MSIPKNKYEAERWLKTAWHDLEAARVLRNNEIFAQACFLTQQSAEKALKAMWYLLDKEPWGHSIQRLVKDFPEPARIEDFDAWLMRAAFLDRFYIPTRYPNGLPDLTPGESYFREDAEAAIQQAEEFLRAAQKFLDRPGS